MKPFEAARLDLLASFHKLPETAQHATEGRKGRPLSRRHVREARGRVGERVDSGSKRGTHCGRRAVAQA